MSIKTTNDNREVAIKVENLSKTFVIPHEKNVSLKSAAINALNFNRRGFEVFKALKEINFEIKRGEFFGIIGRNGSGKSTLLKILAGIYVPDTGKVTISGKLSPFLELGVGFNPELTARDNVFLGGAILGLSRQEITDKFDRIVGFAELEEFIDMKFKNFSSGMQVRLAFSLAINARADILLMDEVLAVGDVNFQAKCLDEFEKYKKDGKTVILVTHDIVTAQKHCDRLMILDRGVVREVGSPARVGDAYLKMIMEKENLRLSLKEVAKKKKTKGPEVTMIEFLDADNKSKKVFHSGDRITIKVYFDNPTKEKVLNFGIALYTIDDKYVFGVNTIDDQVNTDKMIKRGYYQVSYDNVPLRNGDFYIKTAIRGESNTDNYDYIERSEIFKIYTNNIREGLVEMEYAWE